MISHDDFIILFDQIEKKLDRIIEVLPIIETLGEIVLRKMEADQIFGLNKQTLSKSTRAETFEEIGARKVYANLKSLMVYRSKSRQKRRK